MKLSIFAALFSLIFPLNAYAQQGDIKISAMQDEMQRTVKDLKIPGENPAYYVRYTLDESNLSYASAYMGSVAVSYDHAFCNAEVFIRVGNYEFDNTNYTGGANPGYSVACAIDGNYDNIRRAFWLSSDKAYKGALETLARKKAFAEKQNITDKLPDFTKADPLVELKEIAAVPFSRAKMEETVKKVTAVFKNYKEIEAWASSISL